MNAFHYGKSASFLFTCRTFARERSGRRRKLEWEGAHPSKLAVRFIFIWKRDGIFAHPGLCERSSFSADWDLESILVEWKESGYEMTIGVGVGGNGIIESTGRRDRMINREQQGISLDKLPEDCIAAIISHTSQWDACRLACVSSAFAAAIRSDRAWHMLLPSDYALIYPEALQFATKRDVVKALANGVTLADGKERYVLLRRWGGVCRFLSAMAMEIVGGNDTRYWRWDYSKSSCFSKVAHLLATRCLNVSGTWKCRLPPGTYSVIWRLRFANPLGGCLSFLSWDKPLRFMVTTSNDEKVEKELDLGQVQSKIFQEWIEFEVGEIVVRGERMIAQDLELLFMIQELDCSNWKGGLFIDCLALRPTRTQDEQIFSGRARCESVKKRTMCGVF